MTDAAAPTPWDVVKRMRAEGQPREAIEAKLAELGVARDDAQVLLMEDPPKAQGGPGLDGAAAAVAVLAGGPLLGALAVASMGDKVADRPDAPPQVPLAQDDTTTRRCAKHPELAAVKTCRRCGAFACRGCLVSDVCASCDAKPAVHEDRVKRAAKNVAAATFLFFGLMVAEGFTSLGDKQAGMLLAGSVVLGLPFAVLGAVQLFVRMPVPGILAAIYAVLVLGAMVFGQAIDLLTPFWLGTLVGLISTLKTLMEKRRAWAVTRAAPH